ncbi:hypothetical protein BCV72DRAFT_201237, partial [Rhizopus microsporus var. microsporus]
EKSITTIVIDYAGLATNVNDLKEFLLQERGKNNMQCIYQHIFMQYKEHTNTTSIIVDRMQYLTKQKHSRHSLLETDIVN